MGSSFQEQLLALGLVKAKQVKEVKRQQHQKKKEQPKRVEVVDENVLLARQAEEKRKARAKELNLAREEKLRRRADQARIRQLVEQHRLAQPADGRAYRFPVAGTIRRIFVAAETAQGLGDGRLGIVGLEERFEVVPREIAVKIRELGEQTPVVLNSPAATGEADPDDPYAAYTVPDDLIW
jgi:uncharacterized protein